MFSKIKNLIQNMRLCEEPAARCAKFIFLEGEGKRKDGDRNGGGRDSVRLSGDDNRSDSTGLTGDEKCSGGEEICGTPKSAENTSRSSSITSRDFSC